MMMIFSPRQVSSISSGVKRAERRSDEDKLDERDAKLEKVKTILMPGAPSEMMTK